MSSKGEFNEVARILFDSAAKSGILSQQNKKEFAKQLQRLAGQSKKRGGSLGQVSFKISQFVSQNNPPPIAPVRRENVSTAKSIPLQLNLPIKPRGGMPLQQRGVPPLVSPQPSTQQQASLDDRGVPNEELALRVPGLKKVHTVSSTLKTSTTSGDSTSSTSSNVASGKEKQQSQSFSSSFLSMQEEKVSATITEETGKFSFVPIQEEPNIFEAQKSREEAAEPQASTVAAPRPKFVAFEPTPTPTKIIPPKPKLVVPPPLVEPSLSETPATSVSMDSIGKLDDDLREVSSSSTFSLSVDDWEMQREQELNQIQEAQRLHDAQVAAQAEEERLRALAEEWVQSRRRDQRRPSVSGSSSAVKFNEAMYFTSNWETAIHAYQQLHTMQVEASATSAAIDASTSEYSLNLLCTKLKRFAPVSEQKRVMEVLETGDLVKHHPNRVGLARILELHKRQFMSPVAAAELKKANDAKPVVNASPIQTAKTEMFRAARDGLWEQAIEAYHRATAAAASSSDKRHGGIERMLAAALTRCRRKMDRVQRRDVAFALADQIRKTNPDRSLDRRSSLSVSTFVKGSTGKQLLPPLDSTLADEYVLAKHLEMCRDEDTAGIIANAQKSNLNIRDPLVVCALGQRAIYSDNPMRVYALIDEQVADGVALNSNHVNLAITAASRIRTTEAIDATKKILSSVGPNRYHGRGVCQKLMPLLHELKDNDGIVDLYDAHCNRIDFAVRHPTLTMIINTALKAKGRTPLNDTDASSLPPLRRFERGSGEGSDEGSSSSSVSAAMPEVQLTPPDTMLEYAKERNWQAALAALNRIPPKVPASQKQAVALLFTCALSAASEELPLMESIFETMKTQEVEMSTTTYNTVLSAFSKSPDNWQRSLQIFEQVPVALRDASTYSVILSVLGKYDQWQQALDAFKEMKAIPALSKPPAMVYGLGILAAHKHSWSSTLQLFQEMLKVHGAANVKELVVLRVLRSLEDNQRTAEIQKVEREMAKAAKGKKGKK